MGNLDQAGQELLLLALQFIPRLIVALLTFGIALLLAGPAGRSVQRALSKRIEPQGLPKLFAKVTRWVIIIGGGIAALEQVNFNVTGFLAGLGVAGLTIGFALQDITRNFAAGVLLMLRQPFVIDEVINAGGFSGRVAEINIRDTVIITTEGEVVIVPNIKIFEAPITNLSRSETRQRTIMVNLRDRENMERSMVHLRDTIESVPGVLAEPRPSVWAEQFSDNGVLLAVRFWVNARVSDAPAVHSAAVMALHRAIEGPSAC